MKIGLEHRVELSKEAYEELLRAMEPEEVWRVPLKEGEGLALFTRKGDLMVIVPRKDEG